MKKASILIVLSLVGLFGCAYHPLPVTVYGKSAAAYTAPTLCGAVTACLKTETECYYEKTVMTTASGGTESSGCTVVKQ